MDQAGIGVVFDFFGVICSEVAPFWLARHFPANDIAAVKERVVGPADAGRVSQADMFMALTELTGVPAPIIESEWLELAVIDQSVVAEVARTRLTHPVGLLTNSPSSFVRTILSREQLEGLFDVILVSSECGIAKPEPGIYRLMLERLALQPSQVVLVDDNLVNVSAATVLGWHGYLFDSAEGLSTFLTTLPTRAIFDA